MAYFVEWYDIGFFLISSCFGPKESGKSSITDLLIHRETHGTPDFKDEQDEIKKKPITYHSTKYAITDTQAMDQRGPDFAIQFRDYLEICQEKYHLVLYVFDPTFPEDHYTTWRTYKMVVPELNELMHTVGTQGDSEKLTDEKVIKMFKQEVQDWIQVAIPVTEEGNVHVRNIVTNAYREEALVQLEKYITKFAKVEPRGLDTTTGKQVRQFFRKVNSHMQSKIWETYHFWIGTGLLTVGGVLVYIWAKNKYAKLYLC